MDRDGVEAEVIFPEVGGAKIAAPRWLGDDWQAVLSGYNDAHGRLRGGEPRPRCCAPTRSRSRHRLRGRRRWAHGAKKRALRADPAFPAELGLPDFGDRRYDPLWAALSETGVTVMNHLDLKNSLWDVFRRDPTPQKGIFTAMPAMALAETLTSGSCRARSSAPEAARGVRRAGARLAALVLRVVLDARMHQHYEFPGVKLLPSEYFKRQMGATFMYEPSGLRAAYQAFGPDCLYWSTDFPHPATAGRTPQRR